MSISKITTCLWFDSEAEEAANHYVSIFGGESKIIHVQRYDKAGEEVHRREPGSVMAVEFELQGNRYVGLNGGPMPWSFNEAISFQVECEDQTEVDYFWDKLGDGGNEARRRCGWLADKYGVVWQVVPKALKTMLQSEDKAASGRVTEEMMKMQKLDISLLEKAFTG
ncbi:Glyoxalase/Bleomycin resistance protein/Dihydroxybiphenyl dioxygenase [Mariannaea sp. PMI_226]|nr:Glyoxalase/Bleomycin resistance protein/Dihydroxybiphenyl dioxygenase [Mariannaea sp. PMI_226]